MKKDKPFKDDRPGEFGKPPGMTPAMLVQEFRVYKNLKDALIAFPERLRGEAWEALFAECIQKMNEIRSEL